MGGMSTRNEIKARLGILAEPLAKAKFGIWGDVPSQYRAAVDFIRKQGRPSAAAMNELKKAIKQRLAYAAQERDPGMRQMYGDDAGSLENALEYAQRGDKATLLRSAYNMETAVRDDVPNEMFIWAGGDVNWSHPNVKAMLERVSRSVGASAPAKRRAMRPGVKAKMAVNRRKVVQDLEYLRDEARRVSDASSRMDAENWLKRVRARDLKEQDWLEAADAVSQISAVLNSRPGAKAKMDLTDVQRKAGYKWRVAYTRQLGKDQYLGGPPVTMQDDLLFATESAARQWADTMLKKGWFKGQGGGPEKILKATVLMASRPGAKSTHAAADKPGRKVMAESDPAVSAKIRKLMAEGKPQKQAVAIALDMKRRGEI
jgi:hypothetical protein